MHSPNPTEHISILYANARSVISKRNHLMIYVNSENPDFILLSESWINLRDKHQVAEVSLNGYNVFAKCRMHKAGGGVLLYAKNHINVVKINKTDVDAYDSLYVEVTEKIRNMSSV